MFVVDVIPLSRGAPGGTLSYRASKNLPPGTIVEVPLRKKTVRGVVIKSASVISERSALRAAPFMLRAGAARSIGTLPGKLLKAASYAADFHVLSLGKTLTLLVPEALSFLDLPPQKKGLGWKKEFLEMPVQERFARYKQLAEELGKKKCLLLIVSPTTIEAKRLERFLKATLPTVLVVGSLPPRHKERALKEVLKKKTGVVIATAPYALLPIAALGGIVLERESAGGWISQAQADFDYRVALEAFAKERDVPVVLGDFPLRVEVRPKPERPLSTEAPARVTILDAREKKTSGNFTAIHPELLAEVRKVVQRGERAALVAARRGYASAVVCRECGNAVRDARGMPLSFSKEGGAPVFRSSDEETVVSAEATCDVCGSWNLLPLGIGVERIAEELRKAFPKAKVLEIGAETLKTPGAARRAVTSLEEPGTLAVGTEVLIPLLDPFKKVELGAIASADSLLSLPFWRSRERLTRVGLALSERAARVFVATRRPDDLAFDAIEHPEKTSFFKEEAELRKVLTYPPFTRLVSFSYAGTLGALDAMTELIRKKVAPHELLAFPRRLSSGGKMQASVRARIPRSAWPHERIVESLRELPHAVHIRIDSESL